MRERNLSIELLKFVAVVVVLNSHMDSLYGKYAFLGTGGAIGDALFFFASGFTLFLGRFGSFDNWYKRRIKRIYPAVFAWVLVLSICNIKQYTVTQVILYGGGWFVSCIMLYYIALYCIRKVAEHRIIIPYCIVLSVIIVWYLFEDKSTVFMYGDTYFKWLFNFLFMLTGAYVGNGTIRFNSNPRSDGVLLFLLIVIYYVILFLAGRFKAFAQIQLVSLAPLLGVVIFVYKLCSAHAAKTIMETRFGLCLRFISGLCLEMYIVQVTIIPIVAEKCCWSFPINAIITVVLVISIAYLTRCLGRVFTQVFQNEDLDWKRVAKLVD